MASALTSPNLRGGKGTTKSTRVESHLPKCPCCSWCLPLARSSDPAEEVDEAVTLAGNVGPSSRMGRTNDTEASGDHLATPPRSLQSRRNETPSEDATPGTGIRQTVLHISAL